MLEVRDLAVAYASDGDSALLVDPNPRQLVIAAQALRQRLLRSAYGCEIRFGGDAGFVEVTGAGSDARARTGLALLVAARLEPHAPPGMILVTGQFVDAWRDVLGAAGLRAYLEKEQQRWDETQELRGPPDYFTQAVRVGVAAGDVGLLPVDVEAGTYALACFNDDLPVWRAYVAGQLEVIE